MKDNYTHLTVVIDRSGSMQSIRADSEGGINSLITANKDADGECSLLRVDFDAIGWGGSTGLAAVSSDWYKVHHKGPIQKFGTYSLTPRGGTALLDAIGRAITETGEYLKGLPEADRPSKVMFTVMTDGEENSSKEFSYAKVSEMIKHQEDAYQWEFSFLGAGLDVASQAISMGFQASNVTNFAPNSGIAASAAFASHTHSTLNYRGTGHTTYAGKVTSDGNIIEDEGRTEVTK